MNQSSINSDNCFNYVESIDTNYFFEKFNQTKIVRKYPSLGKRIRDREISKKDYTRIISKFFDIYYHEFYFINRPTYFFLGGILDKRRSLPKRNSKMHGNKVKEIMTKGSLLHYWKIYFKIDQNKDIQYIKLKGTVNIPVVEEKWYKEFDILDIKLI